MLYKLLVYVLLVASADALKAGPISRRALLGKATAGAFLSSPLAAFAKELKQASDASVYNRADDGALTSARVIQRAKDDQLVVGKGTLLPLMAARQPQQPAYCVRRLRAPPSPWRNHTRSASRCALPGANYASIAMTAGATCPELEAIIAVDKQAIRFEQDKLEALDETQTTPEKEAQRKIVADVEEKIRAQVKRLTDIKSGKKCGADDASVTPPLRRARALPEAPF